MPTNRDLKLQKFNIGKHRYRELVSFCYQYQEWSAKAQQLEECQIRAMRYDGMPGTPSTESAVERAAMDLEELKKKMLLVEKTCKEVAGDLERYLFKYVTDENVTIAYLSKKGMPCSNATFFRCRRNFFRVLDERKEQCNV